MVFSPKGVGLTTLNYILAASLSLISLCLNCENIEAKIFRFQYKYLSLFRFMILEPRALADVEAKALKLNASPS